MENMDERVRGFCPFCGVSEWKSPVVVLRYLGTRQDDPLFSSLHFGSGWFK